uniref:FCP1 homology domain-containing protein n=1 Tax=Salix viminalis TaxID=40686 RepID=A0A6N2KGC4_SALVM
MVCKSLKRSPVKSIKDPGSHRPRRRQRKKSPWEEPPPLSLFQPSTKLSSLASAASPSFSPNWPALAPQDAICRVLSFNERLPPLISPDKRTVFLDLDETLIHSKADPPPQKFDFVVRPKIDGETMNFYVLKRPGVDAFLEALGAKYEVVVFTAGLKEYASLVLDRIDTKGLISHRLYRDSCKEIDGKYVKDLSEMGRDLGRVVIVDDNPNSYNYQPRNAIPVKPFIDDLGDSELEKCDCFEDMRDAVKEYFGSEGDLELLSMEDSPANSGNTQNLDSRTSDFHRPSKSPPLGIGGFGSQTMIRPEKCGTGNWFGYVLSAMMSDCEEGDREITSMVSVDSCYQHLLEQACKMSELNELIFSVSIVDARSAVRFRLADPQRVCDVCCVRLESAQPYLMDQVSNAAQLPTHDLTDLSTLRSWVNFPWGQTMEYEIYKAANTIQGYNKVGYLKTEKSIPDAILRRAKGLAIITVVKVGVMVTYNVGTGLVIARREDGSWSPPSAISTLGVGWGAQAGGELTDFIIVLRTTEAVKTFCGYAHLSLGAGVSAAVGITGRAFEADLRTGDGGYAACYTYSCSKGAFVGCSLEGSIVTTRSKENSRFYGRQSISASDIVLGSLPRPPAAAILYRALVDLYQKLER